MFINFVADATYKSFVYTCSRVTLVHSWRVILGDACGGIIVGDAYGGSFWVTLMGGSLGLTLVGRSF